MTVDELAQEIRRVDGDSEHRLGAGALAEALMPFLSRPSAIVEEPSGWKLVPVEITLPMQKAYFDVIDKNMERVTTDTRFGRFDSQQEAYRAMLVAAPPSPQPHTGRADHIGDVNEMIDADRPHKIAQRMREIIQDVWDKREGYTDRQAWSDLHGQAMQLLDWDVSSRKSAALNAALTVEPEAGEVTK